MMLRFLLTTLLLLSLCANSYAAEEYVYINPFTGELDATLDESGITDHVDDVYIRLDGTSTTTARIDFAVDALVEECIYFETTDTYFCYENENDRILVFVEGALSDTITRGSNEVLYAGDTLFYSGEPVEY